MVRGAQGVVGAVWWSLVAVWVAGEFGGRDLQFGLRGQPMTHAKGLINHGPVQLVSSKTSENTVHSRTSHPHQSQRGHDACK